MTIEQLKELNIFVLREMARRVGVKSPTSKVKSALINEIIDISNGNKVPEKINGKGRPPKSSIYNVDDVFSLASSENNKNLTLKQNHSLAEDTEKFNVEGYIEIINENVSFIWIKSKDGKFVKSYIPVEEKINFDLRAGDVVEAEAYMQENQVMIEKILKVNKIDVKKLSKTRIVYEEMEHTFPTEVINFNNSNVNILNGENAYLYGLNNNVNTQTIIKLLNECTADVKIYINLSMADKNRIYLNLLKNCEIFVSDLVEDSDYAIKAVMMAIEHAKRMMELGKKVVVAVDDILTVTTKDKDNMFVSKSLMSLAKFTNNGAISVVAIMPKNVNVYVLEKLIDKRFEITNSGEIINKLED